MNIHCPCCNTVVAWRDRGVDVYTKDWSGSRYRCKDHQFDAGTGGSKLEFQYPKPGTTIVPPVPSRWPTDAEQEEARRARHVAEYRAEQQAKTNRRRSAVVALQIWGEDALHRDGVSDADRRLMKAILDGDA